MPAHAAGATVQPDPQNLTIGVLADTHIPDRNFELHPDILPIFQAARVSHILHAGDISTPRVLSDLRQVAPVTAVRGNRDFFVRGLNLVEQLNLNGVRVALMHGHSGFLFYLLDKVRFTFTGYRLERYLERLVMSAQAAQVVIFGHTHRPTITNYKGKLIINPGSATFGPTPSDRPSIGLLHISAAGEVSPEIILLLGWKINSRKWVRE